MQRHLSKVAFPVTRFDAVDGFTLPDAWQAKYGVQLKLERRQNANGRMGDAPGHFEKCPGAYGVFLSHRGIWQRIVKEKMSGLTLILEDDAQCIHPRFLTAAALPTQVEFVWLTKAARAYPKTGINATNIAAYALTCKAATLLLEHTRVMRYPIDRQVAHHCNDLPALTARIVPHFGCKPFPRTLVKK